MGRRGAGGKINPRWAGTHPWTRSKPLCVGAFAIAARARPPTARRLLPARHAANGFQRRISGDQPLMSEDCRIVGYAIVSADGHIADHNAFMPDALKNEADQRHFDSELDLADIVVQGRHSHEGQENSPKRRRLVLSRKVAALRPNPEFPNSFLWNPGGASFKTARAAFGFTGGQAAIIGGPEVYSLFLDIGYTSFQLTRSKFVTLPGGLPVFAQGRHGRSVEDVLRRAGLVPDPETALDEANGVTLVTWRKAIAE
jgi:dihydrofolate reductase